MSGALIKRVKIKQYRSIASCDVTLGALTFLIGLNGSGKSNFLDALRLIPDTLRSTVGEAIQDRGGMREVLRQATGHPTNVGVRVDFEIGSEPGLFALDLHEERGEMCIKSEECSFAGTEYLVQRGHVVKQPEGGSSRARTDRAYLASVSGLPAFQPVFEALSRMAFHDFKPSAIRAGGKAGASLGLARDGGNLGPLVCSLPPETLARLNGFIGAFMSDVEAIVPRGKRAFDLRRRVADFADTWRRPGTSLSDGALTALATLLALQLSQTREPGFVALEHPESLLHLDALAVVRDALLEASTSAQVIVSTHSADLLDDKRIGGEVVLAADSFRGATEVGPIDSSVLSCLKTSPVTVGELLRWNELTSASASKRCMPIRPRRQPAAVTAALLSTLPDAEVEVPLEMRARVPEGVGDGTVRTVSENAKTLKFQTVAFEEE